MTKTGILAHRLLTFREWLEEPKEKNATARSNRGVQIRVRKSAIKSGKMPQDRGAKGDDRAS